MRIYPLQIYKFFLYSMVYYRKIFPYRNVIFTLLGYCVMFILYISLRSKVIIFIFIVSQCLDAPNVIANKQFTLILNIV